MKKLIKLAVVALLAVIVLVILGAYFLDSMIKKGVETVGPKITQTKVTLTRAKVSPWSGRGELVGFVVGNPEGYKTPSALSLGLISLEVKPRSFMEDKIVIRSFIAQSPEITLEGGLKENNLSEILDNVNALTSGQEEKPPKPDEPKGESAETRVQVDHFLIKGAVVKVSVKGRRGLVLHRLSVSARPFNSSR